MSLPPGHVLTLDEGGEPVIERYWAPPLVGSDGVMRADVSLESRCARGAQLLQRGRRAAPDLGRAARRVPQRRDRLERDRRA